MIQFALGVILGVLIRDIKFGVLRIEEKAEKWIRSQQKAQFIEPISTQERFDNAENIDDML
jgi:hypothetical protein